MMKIYDRKLAYPYFVWMTLFTVVPLIIVVYYALTDSDGNFTLNNLLSISGYGSVFARSLLLALIATVICLTLIAVLFVVSMFIISNTIKLTTFDRRDEIAIMKMVGATNGFIRWPFVYEGFMLGLTGAILAFLLQWGLYEAIAQGVANNDTLQLLSIVPFQQLWKPVGGVFLGAGILIGVGGSLSAIRRFLQV